MEAESFSKMHQVFLHSKVWVEDSGSQAGSQHQFGAQTSPQRLSRLVPWEGRGTSGIFHRLQVGICSTMDLHRFQEHSCLFMAIPMGCR